MKVNSGLDPDQWTNTGSMDNRIGSQSLHNGSMNRDPLLQSTSDQVASTGSMDDYVGSCSLDHGSADQVHRLRLDPDQWTSTHDDYTAPRSLDHYFICTGGPSTSSGSAARLFTGTLDNGLSGHSLTTADRLLSFVAARQDNYEPHASSSHGIGTSHVCPWTAKQATHSSMEASAGAQLTTTDYRNTTDVETSMRRDGSFGEEPFSTSSKELGLVTLRRSLDLNESDRPATLNVDQNGLRSSSSTASAIDGSSTGHPRTEDPGGRKLADSGGAQMDCGEEGGPPVIKGTPRHRFRNVCDKRL